MLGICMLAVKEDRVVYAIHVLYTTLSGHNGNTEYKSCDSFFFAKSLMHFYTPISYHFQQHILYGTHQPDQS